MKEIRLFLIPQPGAKPEFLATLVPVDPSPLVSKVWDGLSKLTSKVVLEGYTRDGWAWKPTPGGGSGSSQAAFTNLRVESTDGRNKLKGFVKYLADRQKSAYGRICGGGVWAISYIQSNTKETERMDCRISLDMSKIKDCSLKPLAGGGASASSASKLPPQPQQQQLPSRGSSSNGQASQPSAAAARKKKGGGFGLLGQLVGAQQKTNKHMEATSKKAKPVAGAGGGSSDQAGSGVPAANASSSGGDASSGTAAASPSALRTAAQVLAEFRQSMQDKMLDFDIQDDETLKISVSLAEQTTGLTIEDKEKVTMEILKYMVYEAAEEVNEEWIAYKEPAEFLDESNFTIYKEGAAPPEVLEEINKGELPDEVRAEQRAVTMERQRQAQQAESRNQRRVMQEAHDAKKYDDEEEDDMEALNANKRDRRTIEDYEREKSAKRSRPS